MPKGMHADHACVRMRACLGVCLCVPACVSLCMCACMHLCAYACTVVGMCARTVVRFSSPSAYAFRWVLALSSQAERCNSTSRIQCGPHQCVSTQRGDEHGLQSIRDKMILLSTPQKVPADSWEQTQPKLSQPIALQPTVIEESISPR